MNDIKKVMVVDDDYTTRTIVADYLDDEGYDVSVFGDPEAVGDHIKECDIIIMDVRFGRDRTFAGLEYIIKRVERGELNLSSTTVIFISHWGKERQGVPERLEKVEKYKWLDVSTGLELTELRELLKRDSGERT